MLSVKKGKKILEDNSDKNYPEDEVKDIMESLYKSARIVIESKKTIN